VEDMPSKSLQVHACLAQDDYRAGGDKVTQAIELGPPRLNPTAPGHQCLSRQLCPCMSNTGVRGSD